ncbi:MAG: YwqG family protein [Bacteroidales bacterium]
MKLLKKILGAILSDKNNREEVSPINVEGDEKELAGDLFLESEDSVTITLFESDCTVYDSKVGGLPYMPKNFQYPMDLRSGREDKPLGFLAQINLEQLPPLNGFPKYGILQFFIGTDCLFGLDVENPTTENGFRVIFHEELHKEDHLLKKLPVSLNSECVSPVMKELKMGFTPAESVIAFSDFRFDKALLEAYRVIDPMVTSIDQIPSEILDKMDELCNASGSRIGGFPLFTQSDPRNEEMGTSDYTILLLQLDSDAKKQVMWGDEGVGNFFIRPKDLQARDFEHVLYNWDCY